MHRLPNQESKTPGKGWPCETSWFPGFLIVRALVRLRRLWAWGLPKTRSKATSGLVALADWRGHAASFWRSPSGSRQSRYQRHQATSDGNWKGNCGAGENEGYRPTGFHLAVRAYRKAQEVDHPADYGDDGRGEKERQDCHGFPSPAPQQVHRHRYQEYEGPVCPNSTVTHFSELPSRPGNDAMPRAW
jgi:hypothetical protein